MANKSYLKNQIALSVLAVFSISSLVLFKPDPVQAQQSYQCRNSIESAQSKLRKLGLKVRVHNFEPQSDWKNAPRGRGISLIFKGTADESVMKSSNFMLGISKDIIAKCRGVVVVGFGISNTDHIVYLGVVQGVLKYFEWIDSETSSICRNWGYYCTL